MNLPTALFGLIYQPFCPYNLLNIFNLRFGMDVLDSVCVFFFKQFQ